MEEKQGVVGEGMEEGLMGGGIMKHNKITILSELGIGMSDDFLVEGRRTCMTHYICGEEECIIFHGRNYQIRHIPNTTEMCK